MTEGYKKKLIEVALPLEAINAAGKAEKSRPTGTTRNIHKWFAPMPGPVWRALLAASVLDDPGTEEERIKLIGFIQELIPATGTLPSGEISEKFSEVMTNSASKLSQITVIDPFVGGGSTLIEAQRLGMNVLGSDLNPVPALISRTIVEFWSKLTLRDSPAFVQQDRISMSMKDCVSVDIKFLVDEIYEKVRKKIGAMYPEVNGGVPFAYLWAHTIPCPNPACAVKVPLFATEAISMESKNQSWISVKYSGAEPKFYVVNTKDESSGCTKDSRGKFRCLKCGSGFSVDDIKSDISNIGKIPVAVMTKKNGRQIHFGSSQEPDAFQADLGAIDRHFTPLPIAASGLRIQAYGYETYEDLFLPRQQHMLSAFADEVQELSKSIDKRCGSKEYGDFLTAYLGLCVGKLAHANSTQTRWRVAGSTDAGRLESGFGMAVMPMLWDFAEANPFGGALGDWIQVSENAIKGLQALPNISSSTESQVLNMPAQEFSKNMNSSSHYILATDPPYFDAIGYADLSDFFYIWHRQALHTRFPDLYLTASVPRADELISEKFRHNGDNDAATSFFIDGFRKTFESIVAKVDKEFPSIIVYAHQQKESRYGEYGSTGWEALLEALMRSKISVTASWPIHCTATSRMRALDSNALGAYVALVCRPRSGDAKATDRRGFLAELSRLLPSALNEMKQGSIAPIDLSQASVGPGMGIFSQFSKVIESDGSEMSVRTALSLINQVLAEVLSQQEGDFDSDTRFCLKWFEQNQWSTGTFGDADTLARAMNTSLERMARTGIMSIGGGKVTLTPPESLPSNWSSSENERICEWQVLMHVAAALSNSGIDLAGKILKESASRVNVDAVKELTFQLFGICDKNKWSKSGQVFNALGASWSDLNSRSNRNIESSASNQSLFDFDEE
jgi:putative DNA methylase